MNQKPLNAEELDELKELVTSSGYKALSKYLDALLFDRQKALTDYDLLNGTERLFAIKAEYDGAKKFLAAFKTSLITIKK